MSQIIQHTVMARCNYGNVPNPTVPPIAPTAFHTSQVTSLNYCLQCIRHTHLLFQALSCNHYFSFQIIQHPLLNVVIWAGDMSMNAGTPNRIKWYLWLEQQFNLIQWALSNQCRLSSQRAIHFLNILFTVLKMSGDTALWKWYWGGGLQSPCPLS